MISFSGTRISCPPLFYLISNNRAVNNIQANMSDPNGSASTSSAHAAVLVPSEAIPEDAVHVKGPDMSKPIDLTSLLQSYETIGFQATGMARAIQVVEEMVRLLT